MEESTVTLLARSPIETVKPIARIPVEALDALLGTLRVGLTGLTVCSVEPSARLSLTPSALSTLYYVLAGWARVVISEEVPIDADAHTLIIVPPGRAVRIDVSRARTSANSRRVPRNGVSDARGLVASAPNMVDTESVSIISGTFHASYGATIDLFSTLNTPIVEAFVSDDQICELLKWALAEFSASELGMSALITSILKQILIVVLRRSLTSSSQWVERFTIVNDPQIAKAFASMAAKPNGPHSIQSLASTAGLSRSAFMARFTTLVGQAPMSVLRDLRMRQAASQLALSYLSVDQVAKDVGYASRSSFLRAFRNAHGCEPSVFRAKRSQRAELESAELRQSESSETASP